MVRSTQHDAALVAALLAGLSLSSPALVSADGGRLRGSVGGSGNSHNDNDAAAIDILRVTPTKDKGATPPGTAEEEDLMLADPFQRRMLENHDHLGAVPLDGMLEHRDVDDGAFLDPFGEGERFLREADDLAVGTEGELDGRFDRKRDDHRGRGDAGEESSSFEKRIVNGWAASKDHKAMCITMKKGADGQYFKGHCGCQAISRKHVLLAAHCWSNMRENDLGPDCDAAYFNPQEIYKRDANNNANNGHPFQVLDFAKCVRHPGHAPRAAASNDMMVCETVKEIHPLITADLPHLADKAYMDTIEAGDYMYAMGMGQTDYGSAHSLTNLEVKLPYVSWDQCRRSMDKWGLDGTMMCAGGDGEGDACGGDSGGPLCVRESGGRHVQVGVTSWGYQCNVKGYPGVWSSVAEQLGWIQSVVGPNAGMMVASDRNGGGGNGGGYNGNSYRRTTTTTTTAARATTTTTAPAAQAGPAMKKSCTNAPGRIKYIDPARPGEVQRASCYLAKWKGACNMSLAEGTGKVLNACPTACDVPGC